uniref:Uncharacterized protein n=1 Tax=Candidatus Kentrum eta TaxID=2126337 RepID=A0A450UQH7_9GAMM|nr:MAG: hypothetical protein BECKH772A_GA0070896_1006911 [Candidatus Kentron sp. H]VFJ94823.1 MAG: hypothetical protein BECKH772B_GA0070898_1006711 [Candidatus Kentron sp. H]VFK01298.1 MAG: hypothetical protein BECKH772C_GA0070978_1006211 [Candidatus Kentron sp. H]
MARLMYHARGECGNGKPEIGGVALAGWAHRGAPRRVERFPGRAGDAARRAGPVTCMASSFTPMAYPMIRLAGRIACKTGQAIRKAGRMVRMAYPVIGRAIQGVRGACRGMGETGFLASRLLFFGILYFQSKYISGEASPGTDEGLSGQSDKVEVGSRRNGIRSGPNRIPSHPFMDRQIIPLCSRQAYPRFSLPSLATGSRQPGRATNKLPGLQGHGW